jgi:hypothetical protein
MKNKKQIKIGSLIRGGRWVHGISGLEHEESHGVVIKEVEFLVQVCWSNGARQWVAKDRLEVVAEL